MNIGILETEHFEGTYPVIKLFDAPGNKLFIFTDKKTHRRFKDLFKSGMDRYAWIIVDLDNGRFSFFIKIFMAVKKYGLDLLYINTISNNHLLYALMVRYLPAMRVIITLHDINCFYRSRFSMSLRECVQHIGKRALLRQVREYNVVADTMIPYLRNADLNIKIHNVPGAVFENRMKKNKISASIYLVVPGSIDSKRRNYDQVFNLLNAAEASELSLCITLLGAPHEQYGAAVVNRASKFQGKHATIAFYKNLVDQDEFDDRLDASHFIFIPSVIETSICRNIPEVYGLTKSSGNIFDVIKHAKPFIVPKQLVISAELTDSCFKYNLITEVAELLKGIALFPEQYDSWSDRAIINSGKFTVEKIREKNPSLF